jgi:cell division protein FtsB
MNIDDIIENAQLKGRVIGLEAQIETLTAEVRCLEAVVRAHERIDCQAVANLKAEVERLNSLIANSEQENARLKAEVERLEHQVNYWRIEAETDNARWLRCLEDKERLTKAGDEMQTRLNFFQKRWDSDELCEEAEAWNSAKEGKQS